MSEEHQSHVHHEKHQKPERNIISKIFWGLLLIIIGGLLIANNFGLIDINLSNIWQLWPIFIIAAGFSILSFESIVWQIFMLLISIATLVAITCLILL